jgi:PAS domain-containing protein
MHRRLERLDSAGVWLCTGRRARQDDWRLVSYDFRRPAPGRHRRFLSVRELEHPYITHSLNALLPLHGEGGAELLHNIIVRPISSNLANFCLLQVNDVTVSVTRERVLRERQNARYRAIVDSAPDAIITTDMDRKIQWVNGAAERVFGFAPEELLGQQIDVLLGGGGWPCGGRHRR